MNSGPQPPRRVLIVEDELMIFILLEQLLNELGFEGVGPATRFDVALDMAATAQFDAAILDVNLDGKNSYPVALVLQQRGKPFIFATGYGAQGVREEFRHVPVLQKPFRIQDLSSALRALSQ